MWMFRGNDSMRNQVAPTVRRCAQATVRRYGRSPLAFLTAGVCLLLAACGNSLEMQVQSSVPEPALSPLPISLGVYYTDSLRQHAFEEDSEDRGEWRIETGQAQMAMFQQVLPAMCKELHTVSEIPVSQEKAVDAVLAPKLENMQLALPEETQFDFYEAWVRYKVRLLDSDGSLIAEWPVTGYGKVTAEGMFSSREKNLNAAINAALRDAGGQLALGFGEKQVVQEWLCNKVLVESEQCQGSLAV